jgi:hypothetical protein
MAQKSPPVFQHFATMLANSSKGCLLPDFAPVHAPQTSPEKQRKTCCDKAVSLDISASPVSIAEAGIHARAIVFQIRI